MKRAWTRFSLCASAALLLAALAAAGAHQAAPTQGKTAQPRRVNELTLAGLRPGHDTLERAEKIFAEHAAVRRVEGESSVEWNDRCLGLSARIEYNEEREVDSVTVSSLGTKQTCPPGASNRTSPLRADRMRTGRGLGLGDARSRVLQLYDQPASRGPSTFAGRELELFFYEFDWAGVDVPQLMEVSCDRETGRVVKITLAFPTL